MRVLLDESLPRRLRTLLPEHEVSTVSELGWSGIDNGALLRLAAGSFEVFVTADRSIEYQQTIEGLELGIVVLLASSNRFEAYGPLSVSLKSSVEAVKPGRVIRVGPPPPPEAPAGNV